MSDVSKFNILGETINIKDSTARENALYAVNSSDLADNSRILTVGKTGARFQTINDAILQAKALNVSLTNPVAIFIAPGIYTEQIVLNDIHGLSFIGCDDGVTIIQYNGSYPDCVVHVQGDVAFYNLTIHGLNAKTYAVHSDPVDTLVSGTVIFENCYIYGGTSAIGAGSGRNTHLIVKNCRLSGNDAILYLHNSSYAGRTGQRMTVTGCTFIRGNETYVLRLDDAGYSNNGQVSQLELTISNNCYTYAGFGKVQFRKATGLPSTYTSYLPVDDSNIRFGTSSDGNNNVPGMNFGKGKVDISNYVVMPANISNDGVYRASIPIPVYKSNYNVTLNDVTIPGIGSITGSCSIDSQSPNDFLFLVSNNENLAGSSVSVSITLVTI